MLVNGNSDQVELMGGGPKCPVEKRVQLERGVAAPQREAVKPQLL